MSTTRVPSVIDYLVTTFRAAPTLGASIVTPVTVYDGPPSTDDTSSLLLLVGVDDLESDAPTAATADQEWVGIGAQRRDEFFSIWLTAVAWVGEQEPGIARTAVAAIVGAVEDITRADASLGGRVLMTLPGVTETTWRQAQTAAGCTCSVSFRIACRART